MEDTEGVRELVLKIVLSLVDAPEAVTVETIPDGSGVRFEVHVAEDDLGRAIGKHGRTARCIRTILAGVAKKHGKRMGVDFVRPVAA